MIEKIIQCNMTEIDGNESYIVLTNYGRMFNRYWNAKVGHFCWQLLEGPDFSVGTNVDHLIDLIKMMQAKAETASVLNKNSDLVSDLMMIEKHCDLLIDGLEKIQNG